MACLRRQEEGEGGGGIETRWPEDEEGLETALSNGEDQLRRCDTTRITI